MKRPIFVCLLIVNMVAASAVELSAQDPTPKSTTRRQYNQVFVKVFVPVTSRTPKQDGPVIESWVAEQLNQLDELEYFAVTSWVPVCDALLEDNIVNNQVWDGGLEEKHAYCPVVGDIPERKNGRVLVVVGGWLPAAGCEVRITLTDEPGSRAVRPVKDSTSVRSEDRLPYVAVLVAPPPHESTPSKDDGE